MIGNRIKYRKWEWIGNDYKYEIKEGVVVDAFTKIDGRGKMEGAFGFSEGKSKIESDRIYKVEIRSRGCVTYEDVPARNLEEIVEFARPIEQEKNEEKIVNE